MSHDTIVIGAGLAGLTAALRLAENGQRVLIVARGVGATHLAPATVDVLGYVGDERVMNPAASLTALFGAAPDHPYSRIAPEQLRTSLEWFGTRTPSMGYTGSLDENVLLPTPAGTAKPATLIPRTMRGGDLRAGGRFVFVGLRGFKDFYPSLIAGNLAHATVPVPIRARSLELEPPVDRRVDVGGRVLAGLFDSGNLGDWLVSSLEHRVEPDERVGVPAVLGLRRGVQTWQSIESRLGRPVFEVPTLPPSIPGLRLFDTLTTSLRALGARLVMGAKVVGFRAHDGRIESVEVASGAGTVAQAAGSVVLATGGFASGGLELDSFGTTRETVFDLPVAGASGTERVRFAANYFDDQPLSRAGVAVDDLFRPVDRQGNPVYANLHAVGAILAGAVPWKEKSGTGISVVTGYVAADAILARQDAPTVARAQ